VRVAGEQSSGFKEFCGLAPELAQLADHGYRLYLESLFDELGREVGVLFDRRDPSSLLWPRRQAFEELLEALNEPELAGVWSRTRQSGGSTSTTTTRPSGRACARSPPPRATVASSLSATSSSRHATVVEFLADNTLGRIWYEMTKVRPSSKTSAAT